MGQLAFLHYIALFIAIPLLFVLMSKRLTWREKIAGSTVSVLFSWAGYLVFYFATRNNKT